MKKEITKTVNGTQVNVMVEKTVAQDRAYADGWNVSLRKKSKKSVHISAEKNGRKISTDDLNFFYKLGPQDEWVLSKYPQAYARLGDNYISEPIYNAVMTALDEADAACQDDNYDMIKAQEDKAATDRDTSLAAMDKADAEKAKHLGWCNKCQSYCYGDCTA